MLLKRLLMVILIAHTHIALAISPADINNTIKYLKQYVHEYPTHSTQIAWLDRFGHFLTNKIIYSHEKEQLIDAVCRLRPLYYQECVQGSFGFYPTIEGTRNTIDFITERCLEDPKDLLCPYYEIRLDQNIAQLRYILIIPSP